MLYYFYGQDEWGIKQAVNKIASSFVPADTKTFDGVELEAVKLNQEIITVPIFGGKQLIIVENLASNKKSTEVEQIVEIIKKPIDHLDIIFFDSTKPDKRTSLYKTLTKLGTSREFILPVGATLAERVRTIASQLNSTIGSQAANLLASMMPTDSLRLETELKKLSQLRQNAEISVEDINDLVSAEINPNIFGFVEQLAGHNLKGVFNSLGKLLSSGQNEHYILTMIVWQYRQLIIVRDLLDRKKATASEAGINPYVFAKTLNIAKGYSLEKLKEIYFQIEETEYAIKSGELPPRAALELVAAKLVTC